MSNNTIWRFQAYFDDKTSQVYKSPDAVGESVNSPPGNEKNQRNQKFLGLQLLKHWLKAIDLYVSIGYDFGGSAKSNSDSDLQEGKSIARQDQHEIRLSKVFW